MLISHIKSLLTHALFIFTPILLNFTSFNKENELNDRLSSLESINLLMSVTFYEDYLYCRKGKML